MALQPGRPLRPRHRDAVPHQRRGRRARRDGELGAAAVGRLRRPPRGRRAAAAAAPPGPVRAAHDHPRRIVHGRRPAAPRRASRRSRGCKICSTSTGSRWTCRSGGPRGRARPCGGGGGGRRRGGRSWATMSFKTRRDIRTRSGSRISKLRGIRRNRSKIPGTGLCR